MAEGGTLKLVNDTVIISLFNIEMFLMGEG